MIPIRPINEELHRLHRPVVMAELDDSYDVSISDLVSMEKEG